MEKQETHAPATMPCACTRYGEPLPRLPINTGGRTENRRGERGKGEQKAEWKGKPNVGFFFEIQRRGKEQDRRGKRRAIVVPPLAPPSFLPATTDRTTIAPPTTAATIRNRKGS
jgi:hypothetical protein